MRIVLATANPGKVAEVKRILGDLDVELVPMTELGLEPPEETGDTFEANALLKARAAVDATGLPAIADDSGLEVDALGGAPGVVSASYAGAARDDVANLRKVLAELEGVDDPHRTARFVSTAALAAPDGRHWVLRGTMEGRMAHEARGSGGFGYDPAFICDGETRTNAELAPEEKDARSHRGAAFRALAPVVEEFLATGGE